MNDKLKVAAERCESAKLGQDAYSTTVLYDDLRTILDGLRELDATITRAGVDNGDETECGIAGGECPNPPMKCHYCERYQKLRAQIAKMEVK